MKLTESLFWDTDYRSLDWDCHARFVIERVVMYGTLDDWITIRQYYGADKIRSEMLESAELDPKSLAFLSCIFDTPQEKFKCFTRIRSSRQHWTF